MTNVKHNHAIVIGGSVAGLMAARALTDHFVRVTLIERDAFPDPGQQRRGVPQGRHAHGLLAGGRQVMEQFFPGLTEEAVAAGGMTADVVKDCDWFHEGGCLAQPASPLQGLCLSRPMLEGLIRRRLLALPNVHRQDSTMVEGLLHTAGRVTGVRLEDGQTLSADLVVDASGRGSKMPDWLRALGYSAPPAERVEVGISYTTCCFERSPGDLRGQKGVIIPAEVAGKRGGVMLALEGNRWIVTLIRHFGPAAPTDVEGFRQFAAQLPAPFIHEAIRHARPLGEPIVTKYPASVRRRYEKLAEFPEGLAVVGDAICSFNPVYGQGMTVAALEAAELSGCLEQGLAQLGPRFFRRAAPSIDIPWAIAAGNDLRMPESSGQRTLAVQFVNWYIARFHRAAQRDPLLSMAFHLVANLLAPPASLFHPRLLWRVVRGNLGRQGQRPSLSTGTLRTAGHA